MLNRIHATAPHVISHITQCGRPRQRHIRNPAHQSRSFASRTAHAYALRTPIHRFASRTTHPYVSGHARPQLRAPHRTHLCTKAHQTRVPRSAPRTHTHSDSGAPSPPRPRTAHAYAPQVATQLPNVPHRAPIRAKTPQPRIPRPTQRTYAHPDTLIRRTTSHTAHAYASSSLAATPRVTNSVPMRIRVRANPALHRGQRSRILPMAIAVLSTKASRGSVASQPVVSAARLSR